MSRGSIFILLLVINAILGARLLWEGYQQTHTAPAPDTSVTDGNIMAEHQGASAINSQSGSKSNSAATPFAQVYSPDPRTFADNLKAIGCPEQTIRDIIAAEVHRRFRAQEESLRPTPADHVPFAWSARTTEPRLLERRQQAAALAQDEAATLRDILGCEQTVPVPLYAMTASDLRFESQVSASPGLDACGIRQVQDTYWSDVRALVQRTKGFWLPEDLAALQALKEKRKLTLSAYLPQQ